jgi:bifunctional non-homologous end joining protein LigD
MDEGRTDQLVFFAFDLLYVNGESTAQLPLIERKERLHRLFRKEIPGLRYSEHVAGDGPTFRSQACKPGLEGVISKGADRPYAPADCGIWLEVVLFHQNALVSVKRNASGSTGWKWTSFTPSAGSPCRREV